MIFYQEKTAISLCPVIGATYARKEQIPTLETYDAKKYSHLSVSTAISEGGQVYFEVHLCSFNGKAIVLFLKNGFTGRKKKKVSIIWDGASIH